MFHLNPIYYIICQKGTKTVDELVCQCTNIKIGRLPWFTNVITRIGSYKQKTEVEEERERKRCDNGINVRKMLS